MSENPLLMLLVLGPPLLLSLTVHELAHARTALAFGDTTAQRMGRVSLNPMVHLDPIGTLCLFLAGFGWAKPVPVNPMNLHPRKLGNIMVSLAGPASNLVLAVLAALGLRVVGAVELPLSAEALSALTLMLVGMVMVNIALCVFNMLPLFPLDGHHILREQLPPHAQRPFMEWQLRYGRILLMALIVGPGLLGMVTRVAVPDPLGLLLSHAHATFMSWAGVGF